jgi:uncharacterized membrane protein YphA (DoxX/SURF4 family)
MKPPQITTLVVVSLVALRLGCGWLFYREGSKKLDSGTFTSQHFLRDARGPLAGAFHRMVPDIYGHSRLNVEETRQRWDYYRVLAGEHFYFDDQQQGEALVAYDRAVAQLEAFASSISDDYERYLLDAKHLEDAQRDKTTKLVNFRSTWINTEGQRLDRQLNGWLRQVDAIWDRYEREMNDIAHAGKLDVAGDVTSQRDYYGYYKLQRPGTVGVSSALADNVLPWFTFLVGALLVLGLFTRVAAVGGAAFLLSVIATQPPWMAAAADTNYQIVLLLGLFVCAAIGAGRWGGLDFFVGLLWNNCCGNKQAVNRTTNT